MTLNAVLDVGFGVGFAFPRLIWATHVGYTLIALTLTQLMVRDGLAPIWADRL